MIKHKIKIVIGTFVISALLLIYSLKLEAIGWYYWHNTHSVSEKHALNLQNYHVSIEALEIKGADNASELTYNPITNTLFTVLNKNNQIIELSLEGEVLRTIEVYGIGDMEGMTYIDGNRFVIAAEYDSSLILVNLDHNTRELNVKDFPKIKLGINKNGNKNFEGVSWDDRQKMLVVVKERDPKYVISVKGLVDQRKDGVLNLEVERLHKYDQMVAWAMRDLSGIHFLSKSGHTLLLSDESKLLKEFDENGKPLGAMCFWAGFHGLSKNIPQAEGVTIDKDNNIYIISEPNLFYVFKPQ